MKCLYPQTYQGRTKEGTSAIEGEEEDLVVPTIGGYMNAGTR